MRDSICALAQNPAQTNVSSSSSFGTTQSDDEDFVPYQGERFTVFDWMLFKVFTLVLLVTNLSVTDTNI